MVSPTLPLPLPGPAKGWCEGNQDRCTGDVCPVFGTLGRPSRDGLRRVRGCDDPVARGKRNRSKGDRRERGIAKVLMASGANTRHEEHRGGPLRYESKAGAKAKPIRTAYLNSRAQSDAAKAMGDNRPFVAAFAPDGDGHSYLVVRDDDLVAVAFALVEEMGGAA